MALYAFDGTWNKERNAGEYRLNTNVRKFYDRYGGEKNFYTKGVGTKLGLIGKIFGGVGGAGGHDRINRAYEAVCQNVLAGDEAIDIIGFSRGAALALHFANIVAQRGICKPEKRTPERPAPPIRFLGLWDAVAAFGIPRGIIGLIPFERINLGYKLSLAEEVQHAYHAIALDERRGAFGVTRVKGAYEVWFRGVHSDVGGGNGNTGLSNITLQWMLHKARAVGLPLQQNAFVDLPTDPDAALSEPKDPIKEKLRELQRTDLIHYSVTVRDGLRYNNPYPNSPIETQTDEQKRVALTTRT